MLRHHLTTIGILDRSDVVFPDRHAIVFRSGNDFGGLDALGEFLHSRGNHAAVTVEDTHDLVDHGSQRQESTVVGDGDFNKVRHRFTRGLGQIGHHGIDHLLRLGTGDQADDVDDRHDERLGNGDGLLVIEHFTYSRS